MQINDHNHYLAIRGARPWLTALILASGAAFAACANSSPIPSGAGSSTVSSTSSSSGEGGAGGTGSTSSVGGSGGSEPTPCKPNTVEPCYTGDPSTKDVGPCKGGTRTCKADGSDFGACEGEVTPAPETCLTAEDDDCNGVANDTGDSCVCTPNTVEPCYSGNKEQIGVGVCKEGVRTCDALGSAWSGCEGEVTPSSETCGNKTDEDCDGKACGGALWSILFGGSTADQVGGVAVDGLGNIYVAGTFTGQMTIGPTSLTSAGGTDAFLAKFDSTGTLIWSQSFGDAADQGATGVATDASNNVIVAGYFNGVLTLGAQVFTANGRDAFIGKFGDTGAYLWGKKLGASGTQTATAILTDSMSNIYLTGAFDGDLSCVIGCVSSKGGQDIFLYKFSDQGSQTWLKVYGDAADQSPNALALDPNGTLVLVGQLKGTVDFTGGTLLGSAGGTDVFVLAVATANGATLWGNRYGDPADQEPRAVAIGPTGEIAIVGTFKSSINFGALDLQSAGLSDAFVVKLGSDGTYQWDHSYGDSSEQMANGVVFDAAGNLYITGGFQGTTDFGGGPLASVVSYDQFLIKLSGIGVHQWSQRFGDAASQVGKNIILESSTGNLIFTAASAGTVDYGIAPLTSLGGDDIALVKISP